MISQKVLCFKYMHVKSADDVLGVCKPWKSKNRRNRFKIIWFERFIIGRILYHHAICGCLWTKSNVLRSLDYGCVKKPNKKKSRHPHQSIFFLLLYNYTICFFFGLPIYHLPLDGRLLLIFQRPKVQSDGTTLEVIGVRMPDVWVAQSGGRGSWMGGKVVGSWKKESWGKGRFFPIIYKVFFNKSWFWFQIFEEMDVWEYQMLKHSIWWNLEREGYKMYKSYDTWICFYPEISEM